MLSRLNKGNWVPAQKTSSPLLKPMEGPPLWNGVLNPGLQLMDGLMSWDGPLVVPVLQPLSFSM